MKHKNRAVEIEIEDGKFGRFTIITIEDDTQNVSSISTDWESVDASEKFIAEFNSTDHDFITETEIRRMISRHAK